jgi:hypothetical protein
LPYRLTSCRLHGTTKTLAHTGRQFLLYGRLSTVEAVLIDYYHADWVNSDLKVPGGGEVADLVFSAPDPDCTGRPIRITFGPIPKEAGAAVVQELGGNAVRVV